MYLNQTEWGPVYAQWLDHASPAICIRSPCMDWFEYSYSYLSSDNVFFAVGGKVADVGSVVRALVLDISKAECIVDLSLKPELVSGGVQEDGLDRLRSKKVAWLAYLFICGDILLWLAYSFCSIIPIALYFFNGRDNFYLFFFFGYFYRFIILFRNVREKHMWT